MGVVGWWWGVCISKRKKGVLLKDEPLGVTILYPLPLAASFADFADDSTDPAALPLQESVSFSLLTDPSLWLRMLPPTGMLQVGVSGDTCSLLSPISGSQCSPVPHLQM